MEFSEQFLQQLSIEKQQFADIATWMTPNPSKPIPEVLQGVFFMDGNPLPDDCITLQGQWNPESLTLLVPVFAPRQWTFHVSSRGLLLLNFVKLAQVVYEISFEDETLVSAQITPILRGWRVPKFIADFTMAQLDINLNGDTWIRRNGFLGGTFSVGNYTLRRIVDKDGNYLDAFQDMLLEVDDNCLLIAP